MQALGYENKLLQIDDLHKSPPDGILFLTYASLGSPGKKGEGSKDSRKELLASLGKKNEDPKDSREELLLEWLGTDFSGVVSLIWIRLSLFIPMNNLHE